MYVALAGLIAQGLLAEATFLPATALYTVKVVAIVATAVAVWKVENRPADPPAPNWPSAGPAWDVMDVDTEADWNEPPATPSPLRMVGRKAVETNGAPVYRLAA